MSDLIERQKAIETLKEYEVVESDNFTRTDPVSMMAVATIANCIEAIVELPSVDTERIAKVEYIAEVYRCEVVDHYLRGMCGICGEYAYDHANYCSECGAKLDWSNDE
jgi:hypothetical protein